MTVEAFVNDGLMTLFFLLVGIELKCEMLVGQLRVPRQAALPMLAAVGGVVTPALLYTLVNRGANASGWAIPIATDIAFALGVMSLLGDAIRPETKVFLQTLAIADDILAIVVLALFFGRTPDPVWLAATVAMVAVLFALNVAHVFSLKPYAAAGVLLWLCMYKSGVHATLAGVIIAFFLPARSDIRLTALEDWLDMWAITLGETYDRRSHVLDQHGFCEDAVVVERVMHHVTPPLERAERDISVLVNFVVLPLFAFVNAQVRVVGVAPLEIVGSPVAMGVFVGAVLGKPLGICTVTLALVRVGFARLPHNMGITQLVAVGILGGLGFTMSILIAGLAFSDAALELMAKCAILAGSVASAVLGIAFVRCLAPAGVVGRTDAGGGGA